jgi:hypothetical protein
MIFRKYFLVLAIFAVGVSGAGCGLVDLARENLFSVVGLNEAGTVISARANIRSSYAVVAADLLEVKRGQLVEVLEEHQDDAKVLWYRVRADDEDQTEGWIEAQHVIREEQLEKSRELALADKDLQAQAVGKLRAESNLRLTPEQNETNILLRLDNLADFEIVDWKYVPKPAAENEEPENEEIKAADEEKKDEPKKLDDVYDIWYKVRLGPAVSPAPMGWIFGRQVSLQIPGDIVYFQTNDRKFVTWYRLDEGGKSNTPAGIETDVEVAKPGSWIVLSRSNVVKAIDGEEPDFDGILVLGFDKYNEEHYTAYHTKRERISVWGKLPLTLEGAGADRRFTINVRNEDTGQMEQKVFVLFQDKRKRLRVTPPEDLKRAKKK